MQKLKLYNYEHDPSRDYETEIKEIKDQIDEQFEILHTPEIKAGFWEKLFFILNPFSTINPQLKYNKTDQLMTETKISELQDREHKLDREKHKSDFYKAYEAKQKAAKETMDKKDDPLQYSRPRHDKHNPDNDPQLAVILEKSRQETREYLERSRKPTTYISKRNRPKLCIHKFNIEVFHSTGKDTQGSSSSDVAEGLVPPLVSTQKRIYLPTAPVDYLSARGFGAKKERAYLYVDNGSSRMAACNQFLPQCFKQEGHRPLDVQLIPRSSWGASLANLLTQTSWGKIRKQIYKQHSERCELCGSRGASDICRSFKGLTKVDAHEIWSYHPIQNGNSIQKLEGLLCLCADCHMMFHLGFASIKGVGEHYANRLGYYNGWRGSEVKENIDRIFKTYSEWSKLQWDLDVSYAKKYINKAGVSDPKGKTLPKIYGLPYYISTDRKNIIYEQSPLEAS